jgi:hypothetical protein
MRTWALIKDNIVANVVVWDGEATWSPPAGYVCVETTTLNPAPGPGWTYANGAFAPPPEPEPEPEPEPAPAD